MTTGRFASLYRCGTEETRMEEVVVTEVSLPLRIGANTERRGSALCLIVCTCCMLERSFMECGGNLPLVYQLPLLDSGLSVQHTFSDATRKRNQLTVLAGLKRLHRWTNMQFLPLCTVCISNVPCCPCCGISATTLEAGHHMERLIVYIPASSGVLTCEFEVAILYNVSYNDCEGAMKTTQQGRMKESRSKSQCLNQEEKTTSRTFS